MSAKLFTPFVQRSITARNRVVMAPMCQYSAIDGVPNSWHLSHYIDRARGCCGIIVAEATGVSAAGRISPGCTGIWNDEQVIAWKGITEGIKEAGCVAGIQIAMAGRKASTFAPWTDNGRQMTFEEGGWETVSASAIPFASHERPPIALTKAGIEEIIGQFQNAAKNALKAGFQLLEIHGAHGYLAHQFLSPLTNHRDDEYGGSYENRTRFVKEVIKGVREVWPEELPLWVRISATDWAEHAIDKTALNPAKDSYGYTSWDLPQSVRLSKELKETGMVDLIDTSSGAIVGGIKYPAGPGWQVPLAEAITKESGIATGVVGFITEAHQANEIVESGKAEVALLARELLRNPFWPLYSAAELGVQVDYWPKQYRAAMVRPKVVLTKEGAAAASS